MKGILKNSNKGWFVWYTNIENSSVYEKVLPLIKDFSNWVSYNPEDGIEVEFEIIKLESHHPDFNWNKDNKVAKLITSPKSDSFDKEGYGVTRVIDDNIEKTIYVVLNTRGGIKGNLTWVVKSFETQLEAELYCKDQPHLQWVDSTIIYKTAQSKQEESIEQFCERHGILPQILIDVYNDKLQEIKNLVLQEEPNETWDDVIEKYKSETGSSVFATNSFSNWLKEHYICPVKKNI